MIIVVFHMVLYSVLSFTSSTSDQKMPVLGKWASVSQPQTSLGRQTLEFCPIIPDPPYSGFASPA